MSRQISRFTPGLRSFSRIWATGVMIAVALTTAMPAHAAFHLWSIREVYSDATGSNQFIEFFTGSSSQQFLNGQSVSTANGSVPLSQLSSDTLNHTFLVGTAGITNFGGPKPDFTMPPGFVPLNSGSITFSGSGATLNYSGLPNNGLNSLAFPGSTTAVNSPQNFAGQSGSISINTPPVVTITNLTDNSLFAAPGFVTVGVSATDNGSVANVQLLTNGVAAATNTVAPFGFTLSNLTAGYYTLRARAQDNQSAIATSAPVVVRVASTPVISFARGTTGPLRFQFNSATGITYVVDRGTLTNFSAVLTTNGSGNPIPYSETNGGPNQGTYRVRLE